MLDRANLSARNGWADDHGKVYIYFPEQDAAAMLGCSRAKAIRIFKALDTFGLIERRKQGQGRPDRIYVKDIARFAAQSKCEHESMTLQPLEKTMYKPTAEIQSTENQPTENQRSECHDLQLLGVTNFDRNKTDKNKTDFINTDSPSLNPPSPPQRQPELDYMERLETYRAVIRQNISYDILLRDHGLDPELVDGCVELMAETCAGGCDTVRINREDLPIEQARSRFLKLDMTHITYAIDYLSHTTTQVGNIRAYMLSVLYNAPTTMGQYYAAQISYDAAEHTWEARASPESW